MEYGSLIERRRERFAELEQQIEDPSLFEDQERARDILREHSRIRELLGDWELLQEAERQMSENEQLAAGEDEEIAEMARAEAEGLKERREALLEKVQYALLPRDQLEDRDALLEIRAGTGGDEASLFAADLLGMYQRYAERRGWGFEVLDASPTDLGGFREVTVRVTGEEVFRFLKYESGVHRVQRVPVTETQGRIDVYRSSGAGGQHVNRTESAVQIFHLPTGIMVRCEQERSQIKNRETGMRILRAKLFEMEQRNAQQSYSALRRSLIGSGGREEKIRTYNFPQNRLTDHRIAYTSYNLDNVVATGDLDDIIVHMQHAEMRERINELEA